MGKNWKKNGKKMQKSLWRVLVFIVVVWLVSANHSFAWFSSIINNKLFGAHAAVFCLFQKKMMLE